MASQPIRDQADDHLITPKNTALLIIDYQPNQLSAVASIDHLTVVANLVCRLLLEKKKKIRQAHRGRTRLSNGPPGCAAPPLPHLGCSSPVSHSLHRTHTSRS